jgi:hypothetical protein
LSKTISRATFDPIIRPSHNQAVRALKSFLAGFVSTLTFHQGLLGVLYVVGAFPKAPFNMSPTQPAGVPSVISLAFFGGLWGILIERFVRKYPDTKRLIFWIVYGAVGPTLVALAVVFPVKGIAFSPVMIPGGLLLNGAWGLGCFLILKLMKT